MDCKVCANCRWRDPFTCFCRWRNCHPTPFYWCPAWYPTCWINLLSSIEDENDNYEKFLEELMEIP